MLAVSFAQYPGAFLAVLARLSQVSCGYWELKTWTFRQHVSSKKNCDTFNIGILKIFNKLCFVHALVVVWS